MMKVRRRLLMNQGLSVDVSALVFSYTGTWTDSVMEISGKQYRVLQLKSNGTLTFDEQMVKKKVPFDVWGVGKGGNGGQGGTDYVTGTSTINTSHMTCSGSSTTTSTTSYGPSGSAGTASGWKISAGLTTDDLTADATITNVHSASLGNLFSFSGTSRDGNAWFSLPSGNNGAGGAGGTVIMSGEFTCPVCGKTISGGYVNTGAGSSGSNGIIVIRIPI